MPPTEMPPPIGYICMLRDPDGNIVEFSYDQGVYAKAKEVWGARRRERYVGHCSPGKYRSHSCGVKPRVTERASCVTSSMSTVKRRTTPLPSS